MIRMHPLVFRFPCHGSDRDARPSEVVTGVGSSNAGPLCGIDVEVGAEEVAAVVRSLDLDETLVVFSVALPHGSGPA